MRKAKPNFTWHRPQFNQCDPLPWTPEPPDGIRPPGWLAMRLQLLLQLFPTVPRPALFGLCLDGKATRCRGVQHHTPVRSRGGNLTETRTPPWTDLNSRVPNLSFTLLQTYTDVQNYSLDRFPPDYVQYLGLTLSPTYNLYCLCPASNDISVSSPPSNELPSSVWRTRACSNLPGTEARS